jgi:VIT1/CCC1 family predicted Fe2+/Mn2+ transporter
MLSALRQRFKPVLEPMERILEVLFGLIMVLTFTGSLSIVAADSLSIRAMLVGALGCNLAWGIIDGGRYLMSRLHETGSKLVALRAFREVRDAETARRMIAEALPPLLASLITPDQLETMGQKLRELPEPPARARPVRDDWIGAVAVCLLVFTSTFPVVIPFILISDARLALRASNSVVVAMLFLCGYAFGRCTGLRPWAVGICMVGLGTGFAAIAISLGG